MSRALIVGKVGYGGAVFRPRLKTTDPINKDMATIQIAVNDCARYIVGSTRRECKPIDELLVEAKLPSINQLIVEQIAVETWKGMNYTGSNCDKIPIGNILCPSNTYSGKNTRAAATNCIPPPTKFRCETFAWYAYLIWNDSPALRAATNVSTASRAAKEYAASVPI